VLKKNRILRLIRTLISLFKFSKSFPCRNMRIHAGLVTPLPGEQ